MANDIETRVTALEERVAAIEQTHPSGVPGIGKRRKVSINEFLREKAPGTVMDIVLTIAVYHEAFNSVDSFSAAELLDWIKNAKQKTPSNLSDLIIKHIKKGYFAVEEQTIDKSKKRWHVTNSGSTRVDNFSHDEKAK